MLPTTPAIFVFLFLASVFGAPASELQKELKTFTLQAINSKLPLGYSGQPKGETLQWKPLYTHESTRSAGGPIGWGFEPSDKAVILNLFVQFNAKEGVVFDSTDTARTIIIRKSGQVVLGNLGVCFLSFTYHFLSSWRKVFEVDIDLFRLQ
jgi:hypothetical protein